MELTLDAKFGNRTIRKVVNDDEIWYVVSDVFRAIGKDSIERKEPVWKRKWPRSCRRFEIEDKYESERKVNVLCAQIDDIIDCFGTERTPRMCNMSRWLLRQWREDMDWIDMMDHVRTVAACDDEEEREMLEEEWERDLDRRRDRMAYEELEATQCN